MATYDGLAGQIIAEIGRGDTSLTDTVKLHIQHAIRKYQRERFWFNEASGSISITSSTASYNWPTGFIQADSVTLTANSNRYQLEVMSFSDMDAIDSGRYFGRPSSYAIFNQQFRFYPVPDTSFSVTVKYQRILTTLSATSDTNAWTNEAQNLISAAVRKALYATYYKDPESAQIEDMREREELEALKAQTDKTSGTGLRGSGW